MYRDRAQISQVGSNPNTSVVSVYQSCIRRNTQQKVSRTYSMKVNEPVISSPLKLRQSACKDTHTHIAPRCSLAICGANRHLSEVVEFPRFLFFLLSEYHPSLDPACPAGRCVSSLLPLISQ